MASATSSAIDRTRSSGNGASRRSSAASDPPSANSITMYVVPLYRRREHLDDVRMIQVAQHLRFALETIERARMTLGNVVAQRLDRHWRPV